MGVWRSLEGILQIELTSAAPADMLTVINCNGITLYNISYLSDLTVIGCIRRADYDNLSKILERRGESIKICGKQGFYWQQKKLLRRPVLLCGILLLFFLVCALPTRILFIEVEGNQTVPTPLIIEKASDCGISFGAARRDVRSEKTKNALLAAIPELQWAGVNTTGCTAVISVKERTQAENQISHKGVSSIVAARDGVICYSSVVQGNSLCRVGQAVKEGQVLVSGYTDCGISIQATRAEAEIFAQTLRTVSTQTPVDVLMRGSITKTDTHYSLVIGKKLIKLLQGSGISDSKCVRMYKRYTLTIPGGFQLPISLIKEQQIYFDCEVTTASAEGEYSWVESYLKEYLTSQMVAGQILNSNLSAVMHDTVYKLTGVYSCIEMIGEIRKEEIIKHDG